MKRLLLCVCFALLASSVAGAQQCVQLNPNGTWTTIACPSTPTPTPTPVVPSGTFESQPNRIFFGATSATPLTTGFGTTNPVFNDDGVTGENVGHYFAIDAGKPDASAYLGLGGARTGVNARAGVLNFYNRAMGGVDFRTAFIESGNDGALGRGNLMFSTSPSTVGPVTRMKIAWDGTIRMGNPNVGGGTVSVTGLLGQTLIQSWYDVNAQSAVKITTDGRVVLDKAGKGIVLHSPNNACWELTVSDAGTLTTRSVACP